jgi:hypothetical protein
MCRGDSGGAKASVCRTRRPMTGWVVAAVFSRGVGECARATAPLRWLPSLHERPRITRRAATLFDLRAQHLGQAFLLIRGKRRPHRFTESWGERVR